MEIETTIYIHRQNGWYIVVDNHGNSMKFLYHTRRYALRRFKEEYGYTYKHGIKIEVV